MNIRSAMNEHDRKLLDEARLLPWWEIKEELAETKEGYEALHKLAVKKYHYDEYSQGIL